MARVLIVSNRLPVTVRADADGVEVQPSVGGVATGLWGPHERSGGLWIGWPGLVDPLPEKDQTELTARLEAMRLVQVAEVVAQNGVPPAPAVPAAPVGVAGTRGASAFTSGPPQAESQPAHGHAAHLSC